MARAVIELSSSIGGILPHLARVIKNSHYNPRSHSVFFYEEKLYIEVKAKKITIYYADDEAQARSVIDRLKMTLGNTCKKL
jgi:ArsR family metal-binding transcriptional regulator